MTLLDLRNGQPLPRLQISGIQMIKTTSDPVFNHDWQFMNLVLLETVDLDYEACITPGGTASWLFIFEQLSLEMQLIKVPN